MSDRIVNLSVSRRALMKGGALAAAAASPCLPNLAFAEQIKNSSRKAGQNILSPARCAAPSAVW
ncbi:MAG: twin-arginine translocation signal domain-containing protein [Parasutterella sp.]